MWRGLQRLLLLLALALVGFTSACASLPKRIDEHVQRSELEEASRLLERAGAREGLPPRASVELRQAKLSFTTKVEERYLLTRGPIPRGKLDEHCREAAIGAGLAPWSRALSQRAQDCEQRLSVLRSLERRWPEPPVKEDELRLALRDLNRAEEDLHERPRLVRSRDLARERLIRFWTARWVGGENYVWPETRGHFHEDLKLLGLGKLQHEACVQVAVDLSLPGGAQRDRIELRRDREAIQAAARCLGGEARAEEEQAQLLLRETISWVERWFGTSLPKLITGEAADFGLLAQLEELLEDSGQLASEELRCAVASQHLQLARQRAGAGHAAFLALLHLQRVERLCPARLGEQAERLQQRAAASLQAAGGHEAEIAIHARPGIDPRAYEIVRAALFATLRSRSDSGFTWRLIPPGHRSRQANIILDLVELDMPEVERLRRISSQYLSHTGQIPNPDKQRLEHSLERSKRSLESAERSLEVAVAAYRRSPSNTSQSIAENARGVYLHQLDAYNSLVDRYNATPSLTQQEFYLPYTFLEGELKFGWTIQASFQFGSQRGRGIGRSLDSEFVRLGTRGDDRSPSRRQDVEPTFEVNVETSVRHLSKAIHEVVNQMESSLGALVEPKFVSGLEAEELLLLRWLAHPFGRNSTLAEPSVPKWIIQAGEELDLSRHLERQAPGLELHASLQRPPLPLSPASAAQHFAGLVGEIVVEGPKGRSSSSGAIVSGDGLILTCAHGSEGGRISIRFQSGTWAGTYPVEIVFVHEQSDTALLRAKGLRTQRWMELRLDSASERGEEVIAIGNPSLPGGSSSIEAISRGIVSSPESQYYGSPHLVADIAIASGSSGGPLISLQDGKIVGVTVAVARPEFSAQRASSKSMALFAPAHRLGEWLGLESK